MKRYQSDDEMPRDVDPSQSSETPEEEDAEGHLFLPNDPGTARSLSQGRSSEIEREVRERQREKEARPNRR